MAKTTTTMNLSALVRTEFSWFALALMAAAIVGLVAEQILLSMLLVSIGYGCWSLWRISHIVKWLGEGSSTNKVPDTIGMMDHVVALVHREKAYSRSQRNSYRAALARFNSLAAELPDATVVLDEHNQINWCNTAAHTLLNIKHERDRGQRIDNLLRAPDFQHFLSNSEHGVEAEITSHLNADKTLSLIKVTAGKGMTVLIARDITQRVRVREMRRAFVADVSHELRTPLTVIRGYLEALLDDDRLAEPHHKSLTQVAEQSERMHYIVEHLLELSKLEGNPLKEAEGDPVLVAQILRTITDALSNSSGKAHEFVLHVDEQLLLLGSENEVYSACSNLISNAVNYTAAGTQITVTWQLNEANNPELSVGDNGQGIEAHHLSRLSERFYRVDKARSRTAGGTGLGLAIVKHVAQRHGGQLRVDSQPGQGSCFHIEFPPSRVANTAKVINL